MDEKTIVQEQVRTMLAPLENVALACGVLCAAYLLTIPVRRRCASCESVGPTVARRSSRRFLCMLLSHPAFALVVLGLSLPAGSWLYRPQERPYHHAWLLFWALYAIVRFAEGLLVELPVQMGRPCPLSRFARSLLRLAIMLGAALLLIRFQLGQEIGVLLASTAVVTGIVGLAMRGVLGNLLAGMSLHACRSFAVGEWIRVEGTTAQVIRANWRETWLRAGGHTIIMPNAKLSDATIRNLSSPTTPRRHNVPISVSYGNAPGDVIAALLDAAGSVPEVRKDPAPEAFVVGYRDFCIEYVLRFWSRYNEPRTALKGNVLRMVWHQFQRRGIEIPFPLSSRMLSEFLQAAHGDRFERPLASEIERNVEDLIRNDFGGTLLADAQGLCTLTRDELRAVARDVKRTRFTHGEILMRQNDDGESFYVLVQGLVKGSIRNPGTTPPIEFELRPGAVLGEMSLLTGLPRSATLTAATDCELLEFDRRAFAHLLSLREEIPRVLSELAAARIAKNAESLETLRGSMAGSAELAPQGILHRFRRMLIDWRGK